VAASIRIGGGVRPETRPSVTYGQRKDGLANEPCLLFGEQQAQRSVGPVGRAVVNLALNLAMDPAQPLQALVARGRTEVCPEVRPEASVPARRLQEGREADLRDIVGRVTRTGHPQREPEDPGVMPSIDFHESLFVAGGRSLEEPPIRPLRQHPAHHPLVSTLSSRLCTASC
jgi:hypothetical protein